MKTYTSRPLCGTARMAWDYFSSIEKAPIKHMFYSRDHELGQRWVANYGELCSGRSLGGREEVIHDIETCVLLELN